MKDYGKQYEYDPMWKGPLQKRCCTDVYCLVVFLFFLICWICVGYYALRRGDINNLVNPTDSEGRKCGIDSEVADAKYLVFFNLNDCLSLTNCHVDTVCQNECPSENFIYTKLNKTVEFFDEVKSKMICKNEVNLTNVVNWDQLDNLVSHEKCAKWYLKSQPVLNRCLPINVWDEFKNVTLNEENLSKAKQIIELLAESERIAKETLEDIEKSWNLVLIIIACSGILSIFHIILLQCFAAPFVYTTIFGISAILSYGIYQMYRIYSDTKSGASLTALIACAIILAVVVLCTIFLRKRIYLACQLIKESSSAVTSILSTLIFPVFPWILQLAVVVYSVMIALYLASIGIPVYQVEVIESEKCICPEYLHYANNSECNPKIFNNQCRERGDRCISAGCHLVDVNRPWYINYMHGVNIIGLFWLFFFFSALGQMILAATFATWYWTFKKRDVPYFAITVSIWRTLRYHVGTLAFGSLLITICNLIRLVLEYFSAKVKRYGNNRTVQSILTCCKCCFWLLNRFLKFMNRNAYIMCAIHGKGLCQSASDAFNLLMRNIVRTVVIDKITEWLLLLGKVYITCLAALLTWICYDTLKVQPVNHWVVPVILVTIGSYLISSIFFSVQSAAVDTLYLCFLEDCERNDGSESKPYYMSKRLRKLLHKS